MSRLGGFLLSAAHRRVTRLALWLGLFLLTLAGSAWFIALEVRASIRTETGRTLQTYQQLRTNVLDTFGVMANQIAGDPCSPQFLDGMRRVALLPDGINELLYIVDGRVKCSVNSGLFAEPPALGTPDITAENPFGVALWLDRDLSFLRLDGMTGIIARSGNFGMVVPQPALLASSLDWLDQQLILRNPAGAWWHRDGPPDIYVSIAQSGGASGWFAGGFHQLSCDPAGIHCIAARASLSDLFAFGWTTVAAVLLVAGVVAAWLAGQVHNLLLRYWSFEARFLRQFDKGSVVCAYQPLLDLRSGRVTGCEVLARWRDLDGTIVSPDRFLPIIERNGLTVRFTAMILDRAYAELIGGMPPGTRLQVNFNIFPQDLDADVLIPLFAAFLRPETPFDVVVELVETAEIRPETAQAEIEKLRRAGLKVYIDDFGAGYSSMHTLAALSIDGVKLDRSFAMAPEQSVMGRMLEHAIEMVRASGRAVVVEGVETAERLNWLAGHSGVDLAQGYCISRPLLIEAFLEHLRANGPRPERTMRLVA